MCRRRRIHTNFHPDTSSFLSYSSVILISDALDVWTQIFDLDC